jgi:hypothetical protein
MNKSTVIGTRLGALGVMGMLCTACPNPQTYGTPRTTPTGKIQHSVAAEGFGVSSDLGSVAVPNFPTYTLRVGLADSLDIGARVANFTSLGADLKWNFIKSDSFDMAIDPGFQFFRLGLTTTNSSGMIQDASINVLYLNAPLMFGINVGDSVSIVPTAGITWGWHSAAVNTSDVEDAAVTSDGLMLRPGIGFNFRISERFALHPEVTFLKPLEDNSALLYVFGLGFNFGNLPKYGGGEAVEEK